MKDILEEIYNQVRTMDDRGKVADYIPELAKAGIDELAIGLTELDGEGYFLGDKDLKFTIQSVSKIISLTMVLEDIGLDGLLERVDIKPTTDAFNNFYKLDLFPSNKPSNPMINLGAIVVTSMTASENRIDRILEFTREICLNQDISYNEDVYRSEKRTGYRNRSMAYLLKEKGKLEGDPDLLLDDYFKQCSIEMDVKDLNKLAYLFANSGKRYGDHKQLVSPKTISIVNSIMLTSGMYNYSGEYAAQVGLPSKSGVSGCILGVVPDKAAISVYSPGLDEYGNSLLGYRIMKMISEEFAYNIF